MTDYLSAEQLIQEDIVRWGLKETFFFAAGLTEMEYQNSMLPQNVPLVTRSLQLETYLYQFLT
jgi:hypothetical protein